MEYEKSHKAAFYSSPHGSCESNLNNHRCGKNVYKGFGMFGPVKCTPGNVCVKGFCGSMQMMGSDNKYTNEYDGDHVNLTQLGWVDSFKCKCTKIIKNNHWFPIVFLVALVALVYCVKQNK